MHPRGGSDFRDSEELTSARVGLIAVTNQTSPSELVVRIIQELTKGIRDEQVRSLLRLGERDLRTVRPQGRLWRVARLCPHDVTCVAPDPLAAAGSVIRRGDGFDLGASAARAREPDVFGGEAVKHRGHQGS